jgi:hypothetical protein
MSRFSVTLIALFLSGSGVPLEASTLPLLQHSSHGRDDRWVRKLFLDSKFVKVAQAPTPKGAISSGEPGGAAYKSRRESSAEERLRVERYELKESREAKFRDEKGEIRAHRTEPHSEGGASTTMPASSPRN